MEKQVVVLGAGISGLAAAYWLHKDGIEPFILESKPEPGGAIESLHQNGFMYDRGPNSGMETTPLISQLAEETGIKDEMVYANSAGDKRYILRDGVLKPLPMGPKDIIFSDLFSVAGKLRLFAEPFIGKSEDGYYQSVSQFVRRRLGQEFLDYAINPFVSGVYAGNPDDLSVKSAFPKLYRLEEVYGGLIKGMIKGAKERKKSAEKSKQSAKMFSFKKGMQELPNAIAAKLKDRIEYGASIESVSKSGPTYKITYTQNGEKKTVETKVILSAMPAYIAAKVFAGMDGVLSNHMESIFYPPVMTVYACYDKAAIGRPLDGFGFLIPEKEKQPFLGAIWTSVLFPERTTEGTASFTLFIGGARNRQVLTMKEDEIIKPALKNFEKIMNIGKKPVYLNNKFWPLAIPQYNIGYIEHEKYFDHFEKENKGIILSGNYRGGIALGDCVKNSRLAADKALELLK
ncbi:MAG TPA: protoporphyrinogen oxidase [Ignavibacteriales bacterium]|nr:protoporphyrinogen oxidase [Ignavibacteriales bacterium]